MHGFSAHKYNQLMSRVLTVRLLYVTAIVFTLIAILIHQNVTSETLVCFTQSRNVVYVSSGHTAVGYFDIPSVFHIARSKSQNLTELMFKVKQPGTNNSLKTQSESPFSLPSLMYSTWFLLHQRCFGLLVFRMHSLTGSL